ncbi:hypothetical protein [Deinococcus aerophilus]|uniref:Uncharacterized protein n=1 Tax=Deinococcus aerophilus TaxID=522488 RepID=A0ABQ2GZP2_9DEIO|nr:hypothetical protein [Deinococcus aerophilus]GGM21402.1 hypothetical protein GCM10010841_31640 [Deinococcus aerophilus]
MNDAAHSIANAEQLRLLREDLGLTDLPACGSPLGLTPVEIAGRLAHLYRNEAGRKEDASSAAERTALADHLGRHPDLRERIWDLWCAALAPAERDTAASWLDVGFTGSSPQEPPA